MNSREESAETLRRTLPFRAGMPFAWRPIVSAFGSGLCRADCGADRLRSGDFAPQFVQFRFSSAASPKSVSVNRWGCYF
jgi:hypothetical protein